MPFGYLITSGQQVALLQHNNIETLGQQKVAIKSIDICYGTAGYFSIPTRFDLYHFVITLR